jgi:hypothetical protein
VVGEELVEGGSSGACCQDGAERQGGKWNACLVVFTEMEQLMDEESLTVPRMDATMCFIVLGFG